DPKRGAEGKRGELRGRPMIKKKKDLGATSETAAPPPASWTGRGPGPGRARGTLHPTRRWYAGSFARGARDTAFFFFSSRSRHTRLVSDWSSDVCSSDLLPALRYPRRLGYGPDGHRRLRPQ